MSFSIVCISFPQNPRDFERLSKINVAEIGEIKDKNACIAIINPTAERCLMFVEQNVRLLISCDRAS
jgi:hypothetical protein